MSQIIAMVFSLLLIVAQSVGVAAPVSSGSCAPKAGCCGEDCQCNVSPVEGQAGYPVAAAPAAGSSAQFTLAPVDRVLFELTLVENHPLVPNADALALAASLPLFRLNCALLI